MKGTVWDVLIVSVIVVLISISVLISYYTLDQFSTTFSSAEAINTINSAKIAVGSFNYSIIIITGGLFLGAVLLTTLQPSHPVFIIAGIILLTIFMVVLPQLSNAYYDLTQNTQIATITSNFTIMGFIMNNLPLWGAGFGIIIIIIYYMKWR